MFPRSLSLPFSFSLFFFLARSLSLYLSIVGFVSLHAFLYKQHFYKQRQAEIGKNLGKS